MEETRGTTGPATFERQVSAGDVEAILAATHGDPFAVLGVQDVGGKLVSRCFIPHAESVTAFTLDGQQAGQLRLIDEAGFFEGPLSISQRQPIRYHALNAGGEWTVTDPYSFGPVLGPMDDYYI